MQEKPGVPEVTVDLNAVYVCDKKVNILTNELYLRYDYSN